MKNILNDKKLVAFTPIITTILLEAANVNQVIRMIREQTAEGQSIIAWLMVSAALFLWLNFYRLFNPEQKWAIRGTAFGIIMNALVIITVCYFRYLK